MTTNEKLEKELAKLPELWDRIGEVGGGTVWSNLSKDEWNLARKIFDIDFWLKKLDQARQEERERLAGELLKDLSHEEFCAEKGEQYRECARCYVERKISLLISQE